MNDASTQSDSSGCQTDFVPFQRKERSPGVEEAIAAAKQADEDVRNLELERRAKVQERAVAIQEAIDLGATWAEMGREFKLDPTRIRQMVRQGTDPAA